jgi:hypothetical protein
MGEFEFFDLSAECRRPEKTSLPKVEFDLEQGSSEPSPTSHQFAIASFVASFIVCAFVGAAINRDRR